MAISECMFKSDIKPKNMTPLKQVLKDKGYSYRRAARAIGTSYTYISDVVNCHVTSKRIADAILALPPIEKKSR